MSDEPDVPTQPPVFPDVPEAPDPPPGPPISDPTLMPYALWNQEQEQGARQSHDDARLLPEDRVTPEDIGALGPAYRNGYYRHWADLRDAGVIQ